MLQKLRGHDSEIVSLQWTLIESLPSAPPPPPSSSKEEGKALIQPLAETVEKTPTKNLAPKATPSKTKIDKTAEKKSTRREPPKPIVDAGDMFDIHSYDYLEEEFGTISSSSRPAPRDSYDNEPEDHKLSKNNENFNFVEECQTLREHIRAGNESDSDDADGSSANGQPSVNMTDIRNMMKARSPGEVQDNSIVLSDDSIDPVDELSNRSTIGSSHNTTEIAELEDVIKDLNINEAAVGKSNGIEYLASGAQESFVVIWNAQTGDVCDKIQLKSQGRMKIPSKHFHSSDLKLSYPQQIGSLN